MKQTKTTFWARLLTVMVAVALIMALLGGCDKQDSESEEGSEGIVAKYMDAYLKPNGNAYLRLIPKAVLEDRIGDKDDQKDYADKFEEDAQMLYDDMDDHFDRWSIDYKIANVEKVDKEDLKFIWESYERWYGIEIEEARRFNVDITIKEDGARESEELTAYLINVYVIKVDGKWYIEILQSDPPLYPILALLYG